MDSRAVVWFESVSIFPISPGSKIPFKGFPWEEYQKKPASPEVRRDWKKKYSGCNWALVTGEVSNVVALDFDKARGREIRKERNVYGGPASITPRGGFHTLHRHPGRLIRNKARLLGDDETGGLDFRGDGGYIVIPPSTFEGKAYKWEIAPWMTDPPPLPDWAAELIDKSASAPASPVVTPEGFSEPDGLPQGVGEGQRNATAAQLAGRYLAKRLTPEETYTLLAAWNRKNTPPLTPEELRSVVYSIARKERERDLVLEIVPVGELAVRQAKRPAMIVPPFMPQGGKVILAGYAGTRKSTLALGLSQCVASGTRWLNRFDVAKGKVIYFDAENPPALTRDRIARIARGLKSVMTDVDFVFPEKRVDLCTSRGREAAARAIDQSGAVLAIVDSFLAYFGLKNENDNSEVRAALEAVNEIPRATGATLLIIDHSGKPSADRVKAGIDISPRGASAKNDWADAVLTLEAVKNPARALGTLKFPKVRFCVPISPLEIEMDTDGVFYPSGENELCPVFSVRQTVADNPGVTSGDLVKLLTGANGCKGRTALMAVKNAEALNYIYSVKQSKYMLYYIKKSGEQQVQEDLCTYEVGAE